MSLSAVRFDGGPQCRNPKSHKTSPDQISFVLTFTRSGFVFAMRNGDRTNLDEIALFAPSVTTNHLPHDLLLDSIMPLTFSAFSLSGRHLEAAMRRPRRQERAWRAIYKCWETEHLPSQSDKSLRTIQLLTRSRSFGMGLFIEKPKQGRLVSSRLVSLYCLNPARPSAPTRHTRQRIKTPMCRLGIQSEQTSDTHQLAAAAASSRHRPRSSSLLQRSPPTGLAKKNSGDAASRACGKRKPMQAGRSVPEGRRREVARVKPAPFQMQIQCTRDHHHATAAASGRRRPLGPASGQRRRCITQKNPARPSAPTRHTRQRIKTPMCRLGIQSEQTSDTHQLAAAAASSRHRPRSSLAAPAFAANRIGKKEQRRRRLARVWEAQTHASRFRCEAAEGRHA